LFADIGTVQKKLARREAEIHGFDKRIEALEPPDPFLKQLCLRTAELCAEPCKRVIDLEAHKEVDSDWDRETSSSWVEIETESEQSSVDSLYLQREASSKVTSSNLTCSTTEELARRTSSRRALVRLVATGKVFRAVFEFLLVLVSLLRHPQSERPFCPSIVALLHMNASRPNSAFPTMVLSVL